MILLHQERYLFLNEWTEEKTAVTVSTIHRDEDTAFVKRKKNVGVREEVQCPLSIA